MQCTQRECHEEVIVISKIISFYHGPHLYEFIKAWCPVHKEISFWPWHWNKWLERR